MRGGFEPGDGFDATDASSNRRFAENAKEPDLPGRANVGARAELHRVAVERSGRTANLNDADGFTIFVAKELHNVGTGPDARVKDFCPRNRHVLNDTFVDQLLNIANLRWSKRRAIEVESQLLRTNERPLLRRLVGDDFVQSPVKEMGHRVVALDGRAPDDINRNGNLQPRLRSIRRADKVQPDIPAFLGVHDIP